MSEGIKIEAKTPDTPSLIRGAGLRATRGRVAVYDALRETRSPLNHGELVANLSYLGLDQATIYRNLMALTKAGLLRRTDLGDHVWRFELVSLHQAGDHPHFVCIDCGAITCLPGLDITIDGVVPSSSPVKVRLEGQCDDCA